jgi:SAM-dependent methyltransferase/uncharacterized protein YbaR (Trm112 family)
MKRRHFARFRPVCPGCRGEGPGVPVVIGVEWTSDEDSIEHGTLHCPSCLREYPILDGMPILVPNPREFVSQNAPALLQRDDLPAAAEALVGECAGQGSFFDSSRQHLSTYAWGHWSDLDPDERGAASGLLGLLEAGLRHAALVGPVLDLGCAAGRSTFELASRTDDLVLGCDVHIPMLRLARRVLADGSVRYDRRRVGLVYDRRQFAVPVRRENVDFWVADALAMPFPDGVVGTYTSFNLLDCLQNPYGHLTLLAKLLPPGGFGILATPFDWSVTATPVEHWLGGHGPRTPQAGSSTEMLRALLTPGGHPGSIPGLELVASEDDLPWAVRLHERATMAYRAWLAVVRAAR